MINNNRTSNRIKLAFLIRSLAIGGAERQLVELARGLDPARFEVAVICFYGGGAFTSELLQTGIPVYSLQKGGRWDVGGFFARLIKVLRSIRPDVLHSYMTGSNIVAALIKAAVPRTQIVWGVEAAYVDHVQYGWLEQCTSRAEILLSALPKLIIFNSFAGRDYHLAAGFSSARTRVIQNGIDLVRFAPNPAAGAQLRSDWNIPRSAFVVGLSGRLDPIKDHSTFLKAASLFARETTETRFVCIGGGNNAVYSHQLRVLAENLGIADKIVWPGFVENMPGAYNALDICCSASHTEGTSNALAEAMSCGVPCVATDVGDSRRVIGDTGVLVQPRDPEAMAAAWKLLKNRLNREEQLSLAARRRVAEHFSLEQLISKTSEALISTL